jgi:hypothetical protein
MLFRQARPSCCYLSQQLLAAGMPRWAFWRSTSQATSLGIGVSLTLFIEGQHAIGGSSENISQNSTNRRSHPWRHESCGGVCRPWRWLESVKRALGFTGRSVSSLKLRNLMAFSTDAERTSGKGNTGPSAGAGRRISEPVRKFTIADNRAPFRLRHGRPNRPRILWIERLLRTYGHF